MSIEEFIIQMFCCIADEYELIVRSHLPLRKRGYAPKLTDSEVIMLNTYHFLNPKSRKHMLIHSKICYYV